MTRDSNEFDLIVVGAGVSGLYATYWGQKRGWRVACIEAGSGVGGTWYWNRYPGCRVDIEGYEYSYSFSKELQQDWQWQERYPSQAEVERYLNHVCDRFELRDKIRFNTRVTAAQFEPSSQRWDVHCQDGPSLRAQYLIMATGTFSEPHKPDFDGVDRFRGQILQSARWPSEGVDFSGKRVAIIGTGATGVQLTPIIAREAEHLSVLQRTASYTVPLQNAPAKPEVEQWTKQNYAHLREAEVASGIGFTNVHSSPVPPPSQSALALDPEERRRIYEDRWQSGGLCFYYTFNDLLTDENANLTLEEFFKDKIRSRVRDPHVAAKLTPSENPILTKRLAGDTGYCEAFNRDNVELVDLREEPIHRFSEQGIVVGQREIPLDVVVFATGFDVATGALSRIDIRGRGDESLQQHWSDGVKTYLGMMSHGFPNLFWLFGPGSPFYNPMLLAEYQVSRIEQFIDVAASADVPVEATAEAEQGWMALHNGIAEATLFTRGNNYYMGANIPGKKREMTLFFGGFHLYDEHCQKAAELGHGLRGCSG